jgi:hypothetical protein
MMEAASHLSWPALGAPEVPPHVVHRFGVVPGALPSDRVGLDVLVEELIGVEMRAVARQEEQAEMPAMALHPSGHRRGGVHGVLVHDEEDRPLGVAEEPAQKPDEHRRGALALKDHERQLPAVGDGPDQVRPGAPRVCMAVAMPSSITGKGWTIARERVGPPHPQRTDRRGRGASEDNTLVASARPRAARVR